LPTLLVGSRPSRVFRAQAGLGAFVRIRDLGAVTDFEGASADLRHATLGLQLCDATHVHCAPVAALPPWCHADDPALALERPPLTVDPAEAEQLIHDLRPRQGRPPGRLAMA